MRRDRQQGAVAVEAALVTPLLLLLVFGIIEFGLVFKDMLAVSSSVRAGTRIASAEPRMANFAQDAADQVAREASALNMDHVLELWVYKANEDGTPTGTNDFDSCITCVQFTWNEGAGEFEPVDLSGWTADSQNACHGDEGRDRVGVYMKVEHQSITGLIFDKLDLAEHTVMNLEPIPATTTCKPSA